MGNLHKIRRIENLFFINLVLIIFSLSACGGGDISAVKNGYMNFDRSITVGQAFDGYKYFGKKEWTQDKDKQGRKYVFFKAQLSQEAIDAVNARHKEIQNWENVTSYKKFGPFATAELMIRFTINNDGTFFQSDSKFSSKYVSGKSAEGEVHDIDLKSIFKNEKIFPPESWH